LSTRLDRQNRDQHKKTIIKYSLLVLITVLAIGLIYKVGQNAITLHNRNQLQTVVARYGSLEDKLSGEGLVLRSEITVPAPANGHFENMVEEREKVARYAMLGYYIGIDNKTAMRAPAAGIFTRQVDGLEAALQDIKLEAVGPEVFKYQTVSNNPAAEIKVGQSVFKIVNNLEPTKILVHFPLKGTNHKISASQVVKLSINGQEMNYYKVLAYKKDFKELVMIVTSSEFQEDLLDQRLVKVKLLLESNTACLVPYKTLVKKDGKRGVYCTKGEDIVFKPVEVLDVKGNTAVVEGLEAIDVLITNPEILKNNL